MSLVVRISLSIFFACAVLASPLAAGTPDASQLLNAASSRYQKSTLPILKQSCFKCHAADDPQGDLDLERFTTLDEIRKAPQVWQKAAELIDHGEMPPKDARPLTAEQKQEIREWIDQYLTAESYANAGDPGPVVLRRLSNAEYTYTLHDLIGVDLDPAREFPVDSAAGEGFTNTGNALVMSPSLLTKYFDAGKEIAAHAILLPDSIRFSPSASRSDWTNDTLAKIRDLYRKYSDSRGGDKVNLQGIMFDTNEGGRLPVDQYMLATIVNRDAITSGSKTIAAVAQEQNLSPKYLSILWNSLNDNTPLLILDGLRARWKTARPEDVPALADEISQWQKALFRFSSVGHIGKLNGPKRWMESINPLVTTQELKFKLPEPSEENTVVFSLVTSDAGDGHDHDFVIWNNPRLVAPGRPDLSLRDVYEVVRNLGSRRARILAETARYLNAATDAIAANGNADPADLAIKHKVEPDALRAWLAYLGVSSLGNVEIRDHFTNKLTNIGGYEFVTGWGSHDTPLIVANASDNHVRIPGNAKPHGVAVHPSPTLRISTGWRSPVTATMRIEGMVQHAHPECGNGVIWSLELRRGATRQKLATGHAHGGAVVKVGPIENLAVQTGDLISMVIGARDGNHGCDLTAIDFTLTDLAEGGKTWNLSRDVSGDLLAANPHADSHGNADVWHFYTEPESDSSSGSVIPGGSLLAKWQTEADPQAKQRLAREVEQLLTSPAPADKNDTD